MKLNTNSNTYIIIYSTIMVVIVAFLLAFVSQTLKPMQDANVALDTEKQILNSLNLRGLSDEEAHATYEKIYGAYFNHESETAGLGAEIKDNADWQAKFQGKKIFADGDDSTIALSVVKAVNNETTVDAVTGATVTSTAVSKMLQDQLAKYMDFLKN